MNQPYEKKDVSLSRIVIFALFAVLILILHLRLIQYAFDDSYIHFRVARNLFETGAPYFNAHEPLKVSTSSGWIIFLTIVFGITKILGLQDYFPLSVSLANSVITLGVLIVYSKIAEIILHKQLTTFQRLLLQSILLALLLPSSIGLMETPLAILVAGCGVILLLRLRPSGWALLAVAIYIRLELTILVILIIGYTLILKKLRFLQLVEYFSLGIVPFVFFDLYFYHTVIPQSIIAKSQIYSLTSIESLLDLVLKSMPGIIALNTSFQLLAGMLILLTVFMLIWIIFRESRNTKTNLYPAIYFFSGFLIACFYVLGHSLIFNWYVPLFLVPIAMGLFLYFNSIVSQRRFLLGGLLIFWFIFSAMSLIESIDSAFFKPNLFDLFESGSRVKMYLAIGNAINLEYPDATLLTSEIGGLGYSFDGKVLDAAGLASTDALLFHPMSIPRDRSSGYLGAIPPAFVELTHPDIIVSYDIFAEALLRNKVINSYNVITLPAYLPEDGKYSQSKTIWGSKYVRVYISKFLPIAKRICALAATSGEIANPICGDLE